MKAFADVGEYIAAAPRGVRQRLRTVRAAIRSAAPKAAEGISYGMPFYSYKGVNGATNAVTLRGGIGRGDVLS